MIRRPRVWVAVAVVFLVVNVAGAGFAVAMGEMLHAGIHAALVLVAYPIWRLARMRSARGVWREGEAEISAESPGLTDRLAHLEQSLDSVAIEVGRMGDGQRFMTRFFSENATSEAGVHERTPTSGSSR